MKTTLKSFLILSFMTTMAAFGAAALCAVYMSAKTQTALAFEEKMLACGSLVSAAADTDELRQILKLSANDAKKSRLYLKYHIPLEKISKEAEIKYLYIFMYGGENDLTYIIDAASLDDENWAPPSSGENSEDKDLEAGLLHAFRRTGGVSEMFSDKQWGTMRSGTYPISDNKAQRSMFMTGVDAAVGEIVAKTAWTMTKALAIFALISIFTIAVATAVSRRISKSVGEVKDAVLKIGAGSREKCDFRNAPPEIADIALEIGKRAARIDSAVDSIAKRNKMKSEFSEPAELKSEIGKLAGPGIFRTSSNPASTYRSCAFFYEYEYYAWSVKKCENFAEDGLIDYALIQSAKSGNFRETASASGIAATIFDSELTPIFTIGEKISANADENNTRVARVEFADGSILTLEATR